MLVIVNDNCTGSNNSVDNSLSCPLKTVVHGLNFEFRTENVLKINISFRCQKMTSKRTKRISL